MEIWKFPDENYTSWRSDFKFIYLKPDSMALWSMVAPLRFPDREFTEFVAAGILYSCKNHPTPSVQNAKNE